MPTENVIFKIMGEGNKDILIAAPGLAVVPGPSHTLTAVYEGATVVCGAVPSSCVILREDIIK